MNLIHTLATVLLVASGATGMVFADDLGLPPLPDLGGRAGDGAAGDDGCAAEGDEAADEESGEAGEEAGNSSSSSGSSTDEGNSSSSSSSDGGSETSSSGSSTGNGTGEAGDEAADEESGESDEAAAECEAEATEEEEPAGNETEEAEPVEEEPAEEQAVEDPAVCSFRVDESSSDYLALSSHNEWIWSVNGDVERLVVEFQSHGGLGGLLGDGPEVTLTDGRGRTVAHSDSAGYLVVELERGTDYLAEGQWNLEYESDQPLSDYYVMIDVSCSPEAEEASAEAAHAGHSAEECDDPDGHEGYGHDDDEEDGESGDGDEDDDEDDE